MSSPDHNNRVLAYTTTHGARRFLPRLIPAMRGSASEWFDWLVVLSGADAEQHEAARELLHHPQGLGIQYLASWPENRGQHHATVEALKIAREGNYDWLLRIDDDIEPKGKGWLRCQGKSRKGATRLGLLDRVEWLKENSTNSAGKKDELYRWIVGPRVVGLKHPPKTEGYIHRPGQEFAAEIVRVLGGACRLHWVPLLDGYQPDLYAPMGRRDPESIGEFVCKKLGYDDNDREYPFIRFPDLQMTHRTADLEEQDSPELAHQRIMSHTWPWLEAAWL